MRICKTRCLNREQSDGAHEVIQAAEVSIGKLVCAGLSTISDPRSNLDERSRAIALLFESVYDFAGFQQPHAVWMRCQLQCYLVSQEALVVSLILLYPESSGRTPRT